MTLVIAAQGKDFVILGADSRGTIRDTIGRSVTLNTEIKLVQINERVGILLYGEALIPEYLIGKFTEERGSSQTKNVTAIAEDFASFCRNEARKTHEVPKKRIPDFGFIIAGLDKKNNKYIPNCYSLASADGFNLGHYKDGFGIEGKPMIALYMFSKNYNKNLSVEKLSELVAQAFYDTKKIDGGVGGETKMGRIDSTGFTEYVKDDIDSFIEEWD